MPLETILLGISGAKYKEKSRLPERVDVAKEFASSPVLEGADAFNVRRIANDPVKDYLSGRAVLLRKYLLKIIPSKGGRTSKAIVLDYLTGSTTT
jgi:hypothetical protein